MEPTVQRPVLLLSLDVKYVFCVFRNDLETQCILCILMTQDVVPLCILLCVFWKGMETQCILCI